MRRHAPKPRDENLGDFGPGVRYSTGRQIAEAAKERQGAARGQQSFGDKVVSVYLVISAITAIVLLVILLTYPIWYPLVTS